MNICIYDLEASGLSKRHDRPFQFAACLLDESMAPCRTINLQGTLPRHVLPSPEALLVTGRSFSEIQASPLSHHQFIQAIFRELRALSSTVIMTYNGISFDEEILRHSFYANLLPPYLTQSNGNTRFDVLLAARATAACAPQALSLPLDPLGKTSFRLEALAATNGFSGHQAHDALGDVAATLHIARVMLSNAPEVWRRLADLRDKRAPQAMLAAGDPLVMVGWNHEADGASFRVVLPITGVVRNPNEWLCVGLAADIDSLLARGAGQLARPLSQKTPGPILRVRTNAMPLLITLDAAASLQLPIRVDPLAADRLRADTSFADRHRDAAAIDRLLQPGADSVWDELYSGGLFPWQADRPVIDAFHAAAPPEKWELMSALADPRARTLARWLMCSEWPECMDPDFRAVTEQELRTHLMQDEAAWMTVPSARREVARLLREVSTDRARAILQDYVTNLDRIRRELACAPRRP
jgi:exodeoxyribonuclease-1